MASFLMPWSRPAHALVSLSLTPVRFEFAGYPGQRFSGTVRVINPSQELMPVVMEVEDFAPVDEEGHIVVREEKDAAVSLKSWVRFDYEEFTIFPRQSIDVAFTVDAPVSAEPGTYFGTILARTAGTAAEEPDTLVVAKVGSVVLVDLYGEVREAVRVAGFEVPEFAYAMPVPLAVRFENVGTLRAKPVGHITVTNVFGRTVATVPLPQHNVLPGVVRRMEADTGKGLFFGRYTARLEAQYGVNSELFLEAERAFWFIDLMGVGLPTLLVAGAAAFIVWKRRNLRAALRTFPTGEDAPRGPDRMDSEEKVTRLTSWGRGDGRTPRKMDL